MINIKSILYQLFDKGIRLLIGILIGGIVYRYVGNENYGNMAYYLSIATIMSFYLNGGINELYTVKSQNNKSAYYEVLFFKLTLGVLFSITIIIAYIYFSRIEIVFYGISMLSGSLSLARTDCIKHGQGKKIYRISTSVFITSIILKVSAIYFDLGFYYLLAIICLEPLLIELLLTISLLDKFPIRNFRTEGLLNTAKNFFEQSKLFLVSSLVLIVFSKIDRLMISHILGIDALGHYSVATVIPESIHVMLALIVTNVYNQGVKENKLDLWLSRGVYWLVLVGFMASIGMIYFGKLILLLVYGLENPAVANTMVVYTASIFLSNLTVLVGSLFYTLGLGRYKIYRASFALFINVFLNLILIPKYGIVGAAFSTLISQLFSFYFFNLLFKELKPVLDVTNNSLRLAISDFKKIRNKNYE